LYHWKSQQKNIIAEQRKVLNESTKQNKMVDLFLTKKSSGTVIFVLKLLVSQVFAMKLPDTQVMLCVKKLTSRFCTVKQTSYVKKLL